MICQNEKMTTAAKHWGDAVREHFYSWDVTTKALMAESAEVSDTQIGLWLKMPEFPEGMHDRSIRGLCRALRVNVGELRDLANIEPRGHAYARKEASADAPAPVDWSAIRPRDIPIEAIAAALAHYGVSVNVIAEVLAQAQSARTSETAAADGPGTRTSTPSRRETRAS